jgi:PAS domain S-box-containing protein
MQTAQKTITDHDESTTPEAGDLAARLSLTTAKLAATEARLADAERILADALQSSLSWLWEADENLHFTRVIGPIQQSLGTPAEKLRGKPIQNFSPKSDDPAVQLYLEALKNRKPYRDVILPFATRLGRRWVKASGKPLFDSKGKFLGYRGIASDVTTQIETERQAAAAQRRFMEALENVPASLMLCDSEDRIVFCNSATQRYFPTASHLLVPGTKFEDLLRAHATSGYVEGIGKDLESWIAERMRSHRNGETNITRSYQDGRWSQIVERRTFDGGVIGIRLDITELKTREIEREAAQARLKDAIETMPASLILYDREEKILLHNDRASKLFPEIADLLVPGTRLEDMVRTRQRRLRPESSEAEIEQAVQKRLQQFRNPGILPPDQLPDGTWTQAIERRTIEGGTVCVRIDVTELKRQEEALIEYSEELQRSNAELEQFAYVASHDLQEPLRMVASYCQLLQRRYKDKLEDDANEFIGFAVEGANRMQRLINDLLSYSRVGRKGGDPETMAFADLARSALTNLQSAIAEGGAQITIGEMPQIRGVRLQLVQLLQNIIGNAIKFRREDVVPRISITAEREDAMWRFTVADNGIGIEKEYLDRVFLIFQRLHERSKYPGTGIGLAIAKKVIENHGGRIWIESTPGQGSRFNFTLPAA